MKVREPDEDGIIKLESGRLLPQGYPRTSCEFEWSAYNGNQGRHIHYRCQYGKDHLLQHRGPSTDNGEPGDAGKWRQTYGTVPRSKVHHKP